MPNGTSERSVLIEHCGVGGSVRKGTLYPILNRIQMNAVGASAGRLTAAAVLMGALGCINRNIG